MRKEILREKTYDPIAPECCFPGALTTKHCGSLSMMMPNTVGLGTFSPIMGLAVKWLDLPLNQVNLVLCGLVSQSIK